MHRASLAEIASSAAGGELSLVFSQFLDDFAHASESEKVSMISEEPSWPEGECGYMPFVFAATAHKLANDNSIQAPSWAMKERYCAPGDVYAFNTENSTYREFLRTTSPAEFASRRLYFGGNVLARA